MDHEPEVIRQQMEDTRTALSEKLETLEQKVAGTVETAAETVENVTETVQETVATVKETVQETMESVKEAFDLQKQVEAHPWLVFGGSVALGFLGGYLLFGGRSESRSRHSGERHYTGAWSSPSAGPQPDREPAPAASEEEESSWLGSITETFGNEISTLKGLAVGALVGTVRDMVTQSAPGEMGSSLKQVFDGITTKLGGEPIQGPVAGNEQDEPLESKGGDHARSNAAEMGRKMATASGQG